MRTGDHDRTLQGDELCEELRPRLALDLVAICRGDHDFLPPLGNDRLRCELDPRTVQLPEIWRLDPVPAAHLCTPRTSQQGVARQAGAADADEPDAAALKRRQAPPAPRRSVLRPRGERARASALASVPGARDRSAAPRPRPAA